MRADGPELGEAGEKQWARLRAQIDLAGGFWLGFVFSPSPRSVIVLRERAEKLLRAQTRTLLLRRPESPDDLRKILPYLLESEEPVRAGCTWVEAVRSDSPGAAEQPWTEAWDELFLRMNERRDALRGRLGGGLVFAAPPGIKPRVRDAAPDLWSVRSLVVDLEAVVGAEVLRRPSGVARKRVREPSPAPDPGLALAEAGRRAAKKADVSRARALMRAVEGLLAEGRSEEARRVAGEARELLRGTGGITEARALSLLAQVEEAVGDPAAAADHVGHAIALARGLGEDRVPLDWLYSAARLAFARSDIAAAEVLYREAVSIARKRALGEASGALRDLSIALDGLGGARQESGDLTAAAAAYEESLALSRRLRELQETPEALRDLSISLDQVGRVRQESGDLAAAAAAYEESLRIDRRLLELSGETPEVLHFLAVSLGNVGDVRQEQGDTADAISASEERITIAHRILATEGASPDNQALLEDALADLAALRPAERA